MLLHLFASVLTMLSALTFDDERERDMAWKKVRKLPVIVRALARIAPIAFTEPVAFGWRYATETLAAILFTGQSWKFFAFKIVLVTSLATAAVSLDLSMFYPHTNALLVLARSSS